VSATAVATIAVIIIAAAGGSWAYRHGGTWLMHRSIGTTCPDCSGMGSTEEDEVCPRCKGRRYIWGRE
jgi:DnaJ-class molecular chaperone